ncbi:MAG: hypothetical protein A2Y17_01360 [Clostridiales bacterium GWF2_38_85]|nr:MAG: hypothetical protein A2Y17_01360 [Clostridiales bacterium GWF2_38_85]HBL85168.1 hypothetical protein [Clostridiales bacterium]
MKKLFRAIMFSITFSLIISLFASCSGNGKANSEQDNSAAVSTEEELVPHLEKRDLDGFELIILYFSNRDDNYDDCEFNTDELTGERVNDAFYNRNRAIEEEYNCKISAISVTNWGDVTTKVRQSIESGSQDFHIAAAGIHDICQLAVEGSLYDLNNLDGSNLALDQIWWDQTAIRDISIANKLHFVTGDIIITDNEATWAVYFNKDIIEELDLEDPFTLVRNGEWTIDKMMEMAKAAKMDRDGDSQMTVASNDRWGLLAGTYEGITFMWGCQQSMISKDANDMPSFRFMETENVNAWQKVYELVCNGDYTAEGSQYYVWNDPNYHDVFEKNFVNGNALFFPSSIMYVSNAEMRDADIHYGILPMPKYDENQAVYSSSCTVYWATFLTIPILNNDIDKTTYVMEAMAYRGYKDVTNEYYEKTLKNKRFEDSDSTEMLDLIFRNRTYDLSAIYDWGGSLFLYPYMIIDLDPGIAARVEQNISSYEAEMNETIEAFKAME